MRYTTDTTVATLAVEKTALKRKATAICGRGGVRGEDEAGVSERGPEVRAAQSVCPSRPPHLHIREEDEEDNDHSGCREKEQLDAEPRSEDPDEQQEAEV